MTQRKRKRQPEGSPIGGEYAPENRGRGQDLEAPPWAEEALESPQPERVIPIQMNRKLRGHEFYVGKDFLSDVTYPADKDEEYGRCIAQVCTVVGQKFEARARFNLGGSGRWEPVDEIRLQGESEFRPSWDPDSRDPWGRMEKIYPLIGESHACRWARSLGVSNVTCTPWQLEHAAPGVRVTGLYYGLVSVKEWNSEPRLSENNANDPDMLAEHTRWAQRMEGIVHARLCENYYADLPPVEIGYSCVVRVRKGARHVRHVGVEFGWSPILIAQS